MGKLLARVFDKQYPNICYEPTLEELLGWNNWPRFIGICGKCFYVLIAKKTASIFCTANQPKLRQGLSNTCMEACSRAKEVVLSLCERIKTSQVSVNELKVIRRSSNQILHLFEASSGVDRNKNLLPMTVLKNAIVSRTKELEIFLQRQVVLTHLCRLIRPEVKGADT